MNFNQQIKHQFIEIKNRVILSNSKKQSPQKIIHLPGFLVLGPPQAGKTHLLRVAKLEAIEDNRGDPLIHSSNHSPINWWYSQQAAFLDVTSAIDPINWKSTLTWLVRYKKHHPLQGIILCVSLANTLQYTQTEYLAQFKKQLHHLNLDHFYQKYTDNIPFYLIFTHCDQLQGFSTYFDHLNSEQRNQGWGVEFDIPPTHTPITQQQWDQQCHAFINTIYTGVIQRMHHTRFLNDRRKILAFTLQMQEVIQTLQTVLQVPLTHSDPHPLAKQLIDVVQGIYFCSSQTKHPFFINQLLHEILPNKALKNTRKRERNFKKSKQRYQYNTVYTIMIIYAFGIIGFLTQLHIQPPYSDSISGYARKMLSPIMPRLNIFKQTDLSHHSINLSPTLRPTHTLTTRLLPYLQKQLEFELKHPPLTSTTAADQYNNLRAYLMLNGRNPVDKPLIRMLLKKYDCLQTQVSKTYSTQELERWLSKQPPVLKTLLLTTQQEYLVQHSLHALASLPPAELVLAIAEAHVKTNSQDLRLQLNGNLFYVNTLIPGTYCRQNLDLMYTNAIPQAAQSVNQGDWSFNFQIGQSPPTSTQHLVDQAQQQYLKNYNAYWHKVLNSFSLKAHIKLHDAIQFIYSLNNPQSALRVILNNITAQVSPHSTLPAFNTQVSQTFQNLFSFQKAINQKPLQSNLLAVNHYLNPLISSQKTAYQAWRLTKNRLQSSTAPNDKPLLDNPLDRLNQQAQTLPQPFTAWINVSTTFIWKDMLGLSSQYINTVWETQVLPEYKRYLVDRYPLFKDAKNDVSLYHFTHFFGPDGTLEYFYQRYLQAFIHQDGFSWSWKTLDHQHLNMPKTVIELFMRANLIQKMYFPNNSPQPQFKFAIMPTQLSDNLKTSILNVHGQSIKYTQGNQQGQPTHFIWTGQLLPITLQLLTNQGKIITLEKEGTWSWFRLLDESYIKRTPNFRFYQLTFKIKNHTAQYVLLTDIAMNPFVVNIIDTLRCPDTLII